VFEVFRHPVSWRDITLVAGGLFLLCKGTREIHHALEDDVPAGEEPEHARTSLAGVVMQIMLLDIVFSLDSVITAVGMANALWVMATAIMIAVAIMMMASRPLAEFVQRHPTVKMLALSFLMLIHDLDRRRRRSPCPQGIYAAIGFSLAVEALNQMAARRRRQRRGIRAVPPINRGGAANGQRQACRRSSTR
jgi:predicted tellurium resistance membrane protein TerC